MNTADKKLKIGIIGLGKMGLLHASILNIMPNVQLTALCDKSLIMRKLAKNTLKNPIITDKLEDFINLNLDAVYITTPIPSHHSIVKEIYAKNIALNVFVEKTLTSTYEQSKELCSLAEVSQGHTMVGYMKRFSVTFQKAKKMLVQNTLGAITSFDAYAYSSDFFGVQKGNISGARGGVLEDLGSHVCDLSLWLLGDLLSPMRVVSSTFLNVDFVQFEVQGPKDFTGKFDISWVKEGYRMPEFGLIIRGTEGFMKVDDNALVLRLNNKQPEILYRQNLNDHVAFLLGDSEYYRENDYFIRSITQNYEPELNFQVATEVDHLLGQVRSSATDESSIKMKTQIEPFDESVRVQGQ